MTPATKALSIRQPWAYHIFHDGKDVENRKWETNYRGDALIHSSKSFDGPAADKRSFLIDHPHETFGAIVGIVEIVDCVSDMDSDWFHGPYGFVLRNPRLINPLPCKGMLGFFTPDIDFSQILPLEDAA
jgi:hypothetical protein